jgi:hypothetical protein
MTSERGGGPLSVNALQTANGSDGIVTGGAAVPRRREDLRRRDDAARTRDVRMCVSSEVRGGEASGRQLLPPSSDADVRWRLLRAFETAIDDPAEDAMVALQVAAREFAVTERRQRLPPERAVIGLKTLLAGHRKGGWTPSLEAIRDVTREESHVYAELFRWFITAFFDDERADAPCGVSQGAHDGAPLYGFQPE